MKARFSIALFSLAFLAFGCGGSGEEEYADQMAEQHAGETPEPTAIVAEPRIPVTAEPVVYGQVGQQALTGYRAVPARPDSVAEAMGLSAGAPLPAVLLIHEWWGLNDNVRAMARRLAGEGYRVLAVDLYEGQVAQTSEEARDLMQLATQEPDEMLQNMRLAYEHLLQEHGTERVAVMGWCFGGGMALNTALALPDELDAAVIYYGHVEGAERDQLQQLEMPILGIFGGKDEGIPVSGVRTFESTLQELGKDVEIHVYDEAGHAFANPSGQNYVPEAAQDAWDKTIAFLREHLYGQAA